MYGGVWYLAGDPRRLAAMSIRLLPPLLANQIAAGEVVERPASVLKELLENSLDAGATQIDISIEQGGVGRILVRDNGRGIAQDQLALALSRHATSKLQSTEDLAAIASLGFRGEALASICAVSRLTLTAKPADQPQAKQVALAGQAGVPRLSAASHPDGCSVEVADLFFNTPARRKFLRSEKTEFGHIEDVVKRLALSHFEVGFSLRHNQQSLFTLPLCRNPAQRQQRVARLCGKVFAEQARCIEFTHGDLQLWGWLAPAHCTRRQTDLQYWFVNQRSVRDRVLNHALRQAFAERLPPGQYPCYVLYLGVPPEQVDVNVHPTKHEVRFHQTRMVHDFLVSRLQQALAAPQAEVEAAPVRETSVASTTPSGSRKETPAPAYASHTQSIRTPLRPSALQVKEQLALYQAARAPQTASSSLGLVVTEAVDFQLLHRFADRWLLLQQQEQLWGLDLCVLQAHLLWRRWQQAVTEGRLVCQPLLLPLSLVQGQPLAAWTALADWGLVLRQQEQQWQLVEAPALLRGLDLTALSQDLQELAATQAWEPRLLRQCVWPYLLTMPLPNNVAAVVDEWLSQAWQGVESWEALGGRELTAQQMARWMTDDD